MTRRLFMNLAVVAIACVICPIASETRAAGFTSITATDLDYGISTKNGNSFNFDFSGQPVWTAGSQRSDNGNADANNQRAGRVFSDFQLTQSIIDSAGQALTVPGSFASLTFTVDSIGQGVTGTPYADGLDLRYLGIAASDRNANTLWNTAPVGVDQADILATTDAAGEYTVELTNTSVLLDIANAAAGDFLSFGFSNTTGVDNTAPVGNSTAETYGFQMNQELGAYALNVTVAPEPTSVAIWSIMGIALVGLGWCRWRSSK